MGRSTRPSTPPDARAVRLRYAASSPPDRRCFGHGSKSLRRLGLRRADHGGLFAGLRGWSSESEPSNGFPAPSTAFAVGLQSRMNTALLDLTGEPGQAPAELAHRVGDDDVARLGTWGCCDGREAAVRWNVRRIKQGRGRDCSEVGPAEADSASSSTTFALPTALAGMWTGYVPLRPPPAAPLGTTLPAVMAVIALSPSAPCPGSPG